MLSPRSSVGAVSLPHHACHSFYPSQINLGPMAKPVDQLLTRIWLEGCKDLDETYRFKLHFTFFFGECCVPFWSHGVGVIVVALEMDLTLTANLAFF